MSKMSSGRKFKKGKTEVKPIERRNLNEGELKELLRMTELVNGEVWKTIQVAGNTALIPKGKDLVEQMESVTKVLMSAKETWMQQVLIACGVSVGQAVNVNTETGEIVYAEQKKEIDIDPVKVADDIIEKKSKK